MLNMIHPLYRADIMAIQNHLALEFVPVLLDVVVLDHNDHHIHLTEELIEVKDLAQNKFFVKEKIISTVPSRTPDPNRSKNTCCPVN